MTIPNIPTMDRYKTLERDRDAAWQSHIESLDMDEVYKRGDLILRMSNFNAGFDAGWHARHHKEEW